MQIERVKILYCTQCGRYQKYKYWVWLALGELNPDIYEIVCQRCPACDTAIN